MVFTKVRWEEEGEFTQCRDHQPKKSLQKSGGIDLKDYKFKFSSHLVIGGMTGSGKTVILGNLLKHNKKHFNKIFILSTTRSDYLKMGYKNKQILEPKLENLQKIFDLQKKVIKSGHKYRICLVLDDFIGSIGTHNGKDGKLFDSLITSGRHWNISLIFLTQMLTKISPTIRNNISYWITSKTSRQSIQDVLFQYQSELDNKYEFYDIINDWLSSTRYNSVMIQNVDCYDKNIQFLNPVPPPRVDNKLK